MPDAPGPVPADNAPPRGAPVLADGALLDVIEVERVLVDRAVEQRAGARRVVVLEVLLEGDGVVELAHAREIEQGVFSACVQNGLGTTRGTLTGIAAAERCCGQSSEMTAYFRSERAHV